MAFRPIIAAAMAALLVVASSGAAAPRTQSALYVGNPAAAGPDPACGTLPASNAGAGQVCFTVQPGDTRIQVSITDAVAWPIGAKLWFYDAGGVPVHLHVLCQTGTFNVPAAAALVVVHLAPGESQRQCGAPAAPTAGFVTAAFT